MYKFQVVVLLLIAAGHTLAFLPPPVGSTARIAKATFRVRSTTPPSDGPEPVEFDVIEEDEYERLRARKNTVGADGSNETGTGKPGDGKTGTGAGVFGAVVGGVVGGPLGALTAGLAGAWLAENGEGRAGDAARQAGKATNTVLERSRDANEKYKLTEKARNGVRRGVEALRKTIKEFDRDL